MNRTSVGFTIGLLVALTGLVSCGGKSNVKEEAPAPAPVAAAEAPRPEPVDEQNELRRVYFSVDRAELSAQAKTDLRFDAAWLKKNPQARLEIEGHCDERGAEAYNHALGQRRAAAVKHFLAAHGVRGRRLTTKSFGKDKPADPGHDESAWSQNRRVAFRVAQ